MAKGKIMKTAVDALEPKRLVSAVLVEIDEQWAVSIQPYLTRNNTGA